ncbi:hypothetical protein MNV_970002 [Candidatus Methanoperedens nitroreducens]|uniref:Uncharacterized protein n=1 Tax=Candidatus Methanoperedens nitratireducens TaxID=1392998 RepID=A0A284VUB6_9EURY|nr:hypothetical protein MNV_970002 [Candidatus Methanoperedens nitroreducens]
MSDHLLSPNEKWIWRCLNKIWHECGVRQQVYNKGYTNVTRKHDESLRAIYGTVFRKQAWYTPNPE